MLMWSKPKSTDKQTNKWPIEEVIASGYSHAFNFHSSNNTKQVLQVSAITIE